MLKSFAEQITEWSVDAFGAVEPPKKVVRRLRKIVDAKVGHGYTAETYVQYDDGSIEFVENVSLKTDETNVRLKNKTVVWEERVPGAPGWFRCDKEPLE
jgi:hypothetical protein